MNGIKGYESKRRRCRAKGTRLHRSAKESLGTRMKKKLTGKSSWFRSRRKAEDGGTEDKTRTGGQGSTTSLPEARTRPVAEIRTRTVLFLNQTPRGELASRIKSVLRGKEHITQFRIKVVERTGRTLRSHFPLTRLWEGHCGRQDCVTCSQGLEDIPPCTRSSVVYENICTVCNPQARTKGDLKSYSPPEDCPSLYIGESSRSLFERTRNHWDDYQRGLETSHIRRHQDLLHGGDKDPKFVMKAVSYHKSSLNRQIKEAVRIRRRGGEGSILNSKCEFNRCHIPRLILDPEDQRTSDPQDQEDKDLETGLERVEEEYARTRVAERTKVGPPKTSQGEKHQRTGLETPTSKPKRFKFACMPEDWGTEPGLESEDKEGDKLDDPSSSAN